jgi:hypothetical protein
MTTVCVVALVNIFKDNDFINPLETILRHQWTLPLPFGDAHACP